MDPHSPSPRPDVLIVGGFLTEPFQYGPLRDRLLARGAASVAIANVHAIDWIAAGIAGLGPLLVRTGVAVRRAHRQAGRRPLLVVGHSGGGILARLALSPEPFDGRRADVRDAVAAVVTLGTPHGLARADVRWRHPGVTAAAFLDGVPASGPGDVRTAFVTVGSSAIADTASDDAPLVARLANLPFRLVVGRMGAAGGDGIVGAAMAQLPGATQLPLDDATHGIVGTRWYGDAAIVDRWWPAAVAAWSGAIEARGTASAPPPDGSGPGVVPGFELDDRPGV